MGVRKATTRGICQSEAWSDLRNHKLARTAIHEAGHAFVAWRLDVRLHRVTVKPDGDYLGSVRHGRTHNADEWYGADDRAQGRIAREVRIAYAGALAVKRAFPGSRWRVGAEGDFGRAADIISHFYEVERAQYLWSSLLMLETEALLNWAWFAVEALAAALVARQTLTGREAREVIQQAFTDDLCRGRQ
jgi:hypothetical protein